MPELQGKNMPFAYQNEEELFSTYYAIHPHHNFIFSHNIIVYKKGKPVVSIQRK